MIARGKGGKIINMASQAGRRGEPLVAVYCASKAAVISLTQSAGLNLIHHGINVNAIAPGVVDGEHWDAVDAFFAKHEGKAAGQKAFQAKAVDLVYSGRGFSLSQCRYSPNLLTCGVSHWVLKLLILLHFPKTVTRHFRKTDAQACDTEIELADRFQLMKALDVGQPANAN